MKRIYLLMILFIAFMGKVSAQVDLEVLTTLRLVDTMYYNTAGTYGKIITYGFTNHGPSSLSATTDTLILAKGYYRGGVNRYKFIVPPTGFNAKDTLYPVNSQGNVRRDTVLFTSAPNTNPMNWCDTISYYKGAGMIQADSKPSNNVKCVSMRFILVTGVNDVTSNNGTFAVYPNPAFSSITFKHKYDGSDVVTYVKDMTGKTVHSSTIKGQYGEKEMNIEVGSYAAGMYILEVYANGEKMSAKFTIANK